MEEDEFQPQRTRHTTRKSTQQTLSENKNGEKQTTVRTFSATSKQHLIRENVDVAKKKQKRNHKRETESSLITA